MDRLLRLVRVDKAAENRRGEMASANEAKRTRGRVFGCAVGAALALLTAAPGAVAGEWYDAYERGTKALAHRQGYKAVESFSRAIRLMAKPGENLITYGTNRMAVYYPYLHLAEAYLLVGNPEAAQEALRRSEAQGKEPAQERARLAARVQHALQVVPPPAKPNGKDLAELVRRLETRLLEMEGRVERLERSPAP